MCSVPANMPAKKRNLRFPILKGKDRPFETHRCW